MLNFTPIARTRLLARLKDHARYIEHADSVQQEQLVKMIEKAALTWLGRKYDFSTCRTYEQFASRVPLYQYEDIQPQIMRMVRGEKDVLWPGRCFNFAQSSGTSDGNHKYIPITPESLQWNHYKGASDVVSHYLNLNPKSRLFSGKALILGGSFANELTLKSRVMIRYKNKHGRLSPYAYVELRNYLNAPVIEAAFDGTAYYTLDDYSEEGEAGWFLKGFNGGYINRLRGSLGLDIRLTKSSTLNFYLLGDYIMDKVVDANAEGTKLKSYTRETGFRGWVGTGYEFAF